MDQKSEVRSEDPATYGADGVDVKIRKSGDAVIQRALEILASRLTLPGLLVESPSVVTDYLKLKLAEEPNEQFCCLWLNNRHRMVGFDMIFQGTIDGASVHPRVVVQSALKHNAAAVILVHNHPSGDPDPSEADMRITARLKDALALIDVRVLDHVIVGGMETVSFAETGKM